MRVDLSQIMSRSIKYILFGYTILSLAFMMHHFYSEQPIRHADDELPRRDLMQGTLAPVDHDNNVDMGIDTGMDTPIEANLDSGQDELILEAAQLTQTTAIPETVDPGVLWVTSGGHRQNLPEDYVLSKMFSDAIRPSQLSPYFYRATATPEKDDITMATLVTRDRFDVLSRLASHYQGPISVAVHVTDDETKEVVLAELAAVFAANPDMGTFVDLHLIVDNIDRQFNLWRNVAKFFARTDYIMMLDVDFHLCTDLRRNLRSDPAIMAMLAEGQTAFVVPAFEYVLDEDGYDARTFPTTKAQLIEEVNVGKLDMFHKSWTNGHGATDYPHWYKTDEVYTVTDYHFSYEPYIIYKRESTPWCDERFIGYGGNKAACLYELYLSGITFKVLPNDFLIHQSHRYPEATRKMERQYNRKLYGNFREEVCLRYARQFYASGQWNSPVTNNLMKECRKIRGFRNAMHMQMV